MTKKFNWLVAGIGDIARKRVIPAIHAEPRSELYGLVSRNPKTVQGFGVKIWSDFEAALSDPAIDLVYVATPVVFHAPQTIAALRAGKHVLCEKPTAMNYAEAVEMQRVAEETGRTLGIAYYRRMYPKVQRAKELIAAGVIGTPAIAELTSHDWVPPEPVERGWRFHRAIAGGGPLYDIASHRLDLLNYFFGKPLRVSGHLSNLVHQTEVEDNATVMVEYDSGVRGIVDVRWHSRVPRDEFRIRGTEGEIDLTPLNGSALVYPGGKENIPAPANLHYPCIENFVSAVTGQAELASSGATSLPTGWITQQALDWYHKG